jgi:dUTP pyrophosphatase
MSRTKTWVNFRGNKPQYQTPDSAGADLESSEDVTIASGEWRLVGTGLFLEIPDGYMGMVCPRSGLAVKHGVTVLNGPGILDSDFRGEVKVVLINHSRQDFLIKKGDRIAQLVFSPVTQATLVHKETLSSTSRGSGGFGSTGV